MFGPEIAKVEKKIREEREKKIRERAERERELREERERKVREARERRVHEYTEFESNYTYGELSREDEKNFHKISTANKPVTIQKCIEIAQKSGHICNGYTDKPCQYMAFKKLMGNKTNAEVEADEREELGDCWVGGSENDTSLFTGKTGIKVYLTPLPGGNTILDREKAAAVRQQKQIEKKKEEMDKQLERNALYLRSLEQNKPYEEVVKDYEREKSKKEYEKERQKLNRKTNILKDKYGTTRNNTNLQNNLLFEKNRVINDKEQYITNNYKKLSFLDSKILKLSELIKTNNQKFQINDNVTYLLYGLVIIFIILTIVMIIYYGIKYAKVPAVMTA